MMLLRLLASTLCNLKEDRSYASMAVPQPDCESPEAEEVAALEVVDWAAARLATARTKAVVYCIVRVDVMLIWITSSKETFAVFKCRWNVTSLSLVVWVVECNGR